MVLAAGMSKRMRPLTDRLPKPLVSLAGKPLIDHVLDKLVSAGICRAVINVHYLAEQIEQHVRARTTPEIEISDERNALLDTGGGVKQAAAKLGKQPFWVHNSDAVWIDGNRDALGDMRNNWQPGNMDLLMLLAKRQHTLGYPGNGDFLLSPERQIERPARGEPAPYVFAGVSIMKPDLLKNTPEGAFSLNSIWDTAIENERAFGVVLDGLWMHVGTPQAVEEAEHAISNQSR